MILVLRKKLVREMVVAQLKYQPTSFDFGERGRREKELKEKMAQLTSAEKRAVKDEVEREKFLRLKNLFENYYR